MQHHYDVHGLVSVVSDVALPELAAMRATSTSGTPTIAVTTAGPWPTDPTLHYRESGRKVGFEIAVTLRPDGDGQAATRRTAEVRASRLLRLSPHVLYTNVVEPLLRWALVERDHALVHAACLASGDDAYLVTARTDTGKTTTVLKLLARRPDFQFLSDDLVVVDSTGRLRAYPKPLTISSHTVHALGQTDLTPRQKTMLTYQSRVHSRAGRRFAFQLAGMKLPVATINAVVQLVIPPPKYHVGQLVPGTTVGKEAELAGLFIIERTEEERSTLELEPEVALETLLANCEDAYGFPPYEELAGSLLSTSPALRSRERDIIASALRGKPATLLRSPDLDWAERIPELIPS